MRAVDIIIKKRDKQELTSQEIEFFVQGIYQWGNSRLSGICFCNGGYAERHDSLRNSRP